MGRAIALGLVAMLILSGLLVLAPAAAANFPPPYADAGDDQTVAEGDDVTLDGSGSRDLNNDPLTYEWDFDASDGSGDVDAKGKIVTTTYKDSDVYIVTLTVSDGDYESTDECRITVLPRSPDDLPPKAIIREPIPGVYNISLPVNFTGYGVDPEGHMLSGWWDFGDGKGHYYPETSHRYADEGAYHIMWSVTDGNSNNTAHTMIYVGDEIPPPEVNRRPNAVITIGTTVLEEGQRTWVSAEDSSDPDGDDLSYSWDLDFSATSGIDEDSTEANVTLHYNDSGTYTILLQVRDGNPGGWDSAQMDVTVHERPNDPPEVEAGNDVEITLGAQVTFKGSASDPDGDSLTSFEWNFGDGTLWQSDTHEQVNYTYQEIGNYTAILTVQDEGGASGSDTRLITINPPRDLPPKADAGPDKTVMEGQTVYLYGTATDDFGIARYEWDFNSDGVWDCESPHSGQAPWLYAVPGVYTAILRVTDTPRTGSGPGQTGTDSAIITVQQNLPPDAKILVDTLFVQAGELVRFRSGSTDPEEGKLAHAWDLDGDGVTDSTVSGPIWSYNREGDYQVTLTVKDDKGQTDSDVITMQVSQTYSVELEPEDTYRELEPGQRHEFRFTVTNKGNGLDKFKITLSGMNSNWGTLDRTVLTLNATQRQTLKLTVKVTSTALSTEEFDVFITASSDYGSAEDSINIRVTVRQVFDLKVTVDTSKVEMKPGETREGVVRITITNTGNGPDSFGVSFSGDIQGFLKPSTPKVDLEPGETRDVEVKATVIESSTGGDYLGTIIVRSTNPSATETFDFMVIVEGPEDDFDIHGFFRNWTGLALIVVLVLLIIVVLMAAGRRSRRRVDRAVSS
jgi:PKD repeat protein